MPLTTGTVRDLQDDDELNFFGRVFRFHPLPKDDREEVPSQSIVPKSPRKARRSAASNPDGPSTPRKRRRKSSAANIMAPEMQSHIQDPTTCPADTENPNSVAQLEANAKSIMSQLREELAEEPGYSMEQPVEKPPNDTERATLDHPTNDSEMANDGIFSSEEDELPLANIQPIDVSPSQQSTLPAEEDESPAVESYMESEPTMKFEQPEPTKEAQDTVAPVTAAAQLANDGPDLPVAAVKPDPAVANEQQVQEHDPISDPPPSTQAASAPQTPALSRKPSYMRETAASAAKSTFTPIRGAPTRGSVTTPRRSAGLGSRSTSKTGIPVPKGSKIKLGEPAAQKEMVSKADGGDGIGRSEPKSNLAGGSASGLGTPNVDRRFWQELDRFKASAMETKRDPLNVPVTDDKARTHGKGGLVGAVQVDKVVTAVKQVDDAKTTSAPPPSLEQPPTQQTEEEQAPSSGDDRALVAAQAEVQLSAGDKGKETEVLTPSRRASKRIASPSRKRLSFLATSGGKASALASDDNALEEVSREKQKQSVSKEKLAFPPIGENAQEGKKDVPNVVIEQTAETPQNEGANEEDKSPADAAPNSPKFTDLLSIPAPASPTTAPDTPSKSAPGSLKQNRVVTFGPPLSPEVYDRAAPPSTPIQRGRQLTPRSGAGGKLKSVLKSVRTTVLMGEFAKSRVGSFSSDEGSVGSGVLAEGGNEVGNPFVEGSGSVGAEGVRDEVVGATPMEVEGASGDVVAGKKEDGVVVAEEEEVAPLAAVSKEDEPRIVVPDSLEAAMDLSSGTAVGGDEMDGENPVEQTPSITDDSGAAGEPQRDTFRMESQNSDEAVHIPQKDSPQRDDVTPTPTPGKKGGYLGMKEMFNTPTQNPDIDLEGASDLLRTPAAPGSQNPPSARKGKAVEETPGRRGAYIGMKEMFNTPRGEVDVGFVGVREMLKTPRKEGAVENLVGVREMMKTPSQGTAVKNFVGVREMMKTPVTSKGSEDFVGVKETMKTPISAKPVENFVGVKELMKTPAASNVEVNFTGLKEMVKTPKVGETGGLANASFSGVRTMFGTPSAGGTEKTPKLIVQDSLLSREGSGDAEVDAEGKQASTPEHAVPSEGEKAPAEEPAKAPSPLLDTPSRKRNTRSEPVVEIAEKLTPEQRAKARESFAGGEGGVSAKDLFGVFDGGEEPADVAEGKKGAKKGGRKGKKMEVEVEVVAVEDEAHVEEEVHEEEVKPVTRRGRARKLPEVTTEVQEETVVKRSGRRGKKAAVVAEEEIVAVTEASHVLQEVSPTEENAAETASPEDNASSEVQQQSDEQMVEPVGRVTGRRTRSSKRKARGGESEEDGQLQVEEKSGRNTRRPRLTKKDAEPVDDAADAVDGQPTEEEEGSGSAVPPGGEDVPQQDVPEESEESAPKRKAGGKRRGGKGKAEDVVPETHPEGTETEAEPLNVIPESATEPVEAEIAPQTAASETIQKAAPMKSAMKSKDKTVAKEIPTVSFYGVASPRPAERRVEREEDVEVPKRGGRKRGRAVEVGGAVAEVSGAQDVVEEVVQVVETPKKKRGRPSKRQKVDGKEDAQGQEGAESVVQTEDDPIEVVPVSKGRRTRSRRRGEEDVEEGTNILTEGEAVVDVVADVPVNVGPTPRGRRTRASQRDGTSKADGGQEAMTSVNDENVPVGRRAGSRKGKKGDVVAERGAGENGSSTDEAVLSQEAVVTARSTRGRKRGREVVQSENVEVDVGDGVEGGDAKEERAQSRKGKGRRGKSVAEREEDPAVGDEEGWVVVDMAVEEAPKPKRGGRTKKVVEAKEDLDLVVEQAPETKALVARATRSKKGAVDVGSVEVEAEAENDESPTKKRKVGRKGPAKKGQDGEGGGGSEGVGAVRRRLRSRG
ncbi:hypothetical protein HDV00_001101 [Rhizophlyctis rosea]|nr:hypothetical protein HDV00_001101 [Rhizophlyctis rosea]